ncbi:MAG: hypothetical protein ABSF44_09990 [Candidatus Bathyarchaeia archaeon]|jgi:hypothetical protein
MKSARDYLRDWFPRIPVKLTQPVIEIVDLINGRVFSLSPRARRVRANQKQLLETNYSKNTKRLIIFLAPGLDIVNGGILSISSIFEETNKLKHIHNAETLLCNYPCDPPLLKYSKFENDNIMFSFSQVLTYFDKLENLQLHIPEHAIPKFLLSLSRNDYLSLKRIKNIQINIMIQNIDSLPSMKYIEKLGRFGKLTCTTGHSKYSTIELRNKLGFPLHGLSVFVSPEKYHFKNYCEKENLMIISPDLHPRRSEVLNLIARQFPHLKLQTIRKMTYQEYKATISKAKWALTFGEGLDGYFVEPIFSGGISFSVYNPSFFTEDFRSLRTVYGDYDALIEKIGFDLKYLDNEENYKDYQSEQFELCHKHYEYNEYLKNLKSFLKGDYTYK